MSHATSREPARKQRMDWVDIIKATSVILVVLLHVTQTLDFAADGTIISGFWNGVMTFLEPLRMPVFFVVSGILASSAVKRDWKFTKARTIGIFYLFLVWHTLLFFFQMLVDILFKGGVDGGAANAFHDYVVQIFITPGGYWYFYALVLYFVLARLLRNFNPYLVLGVAAAINLLRPWTVDFVNAVLEPLGVSNMMPSVVLNAVYFLAGVYLVQIFRDFAQRNDTRWLIGTATVAILGSTARLLSPELAAMSFLPIAVAWILTAILVAVRLQKNEKVVAFGRYVGPRTLPIFVIQFFVTDLLYTIFGLTGGTLLAGSPMLQLIYPVVVTLSIVVASLWIYEKAMQHPRARLLFKAPVAWTAAPAVAVTQAPVAAVVPVAVAPVQVAEVPEVPVAVAPVQVAEVPEVPVAVAPVQVAEVPAAVAAVSALPDAPATQVPAQRDWTTGELRAFVQV